MQGGGSLNFLEVLRFVVERLDGSPYASFVNALLFLLFLALVFAAIAALIRPPEREMLRRVLESANRKLTESARYAPPLEAFRERTWPYVDFGLALYLVLVGMYSTLIVALALILGYQKAAWHILMLAMLWIFVSTIYTRINLAAASRAWHTIQLRSKNKR